MTRQFRGRALAWHAIALALTLAPLPFAASAAVDVANTGTIELAFTPGDAIDRKIVAAIDAAQQDVRVLAYSFTSRRIAEALAAAHARGIVVEIVADRGQTLELPQSVLAGLARDGIPVWLDGNFGAAHNKVMVIDAATERATTITGSYNFTIAAQMRNAENAVIFRGNPDVATAYVAYFQRRQARAQRWQGGAAPIGRDRIR